MDNTFTRALLGFCALTFATALMCAVALWALDAYGGGAWWASLLTVMIGLVAEISIYASTLHEPIYDWIKEPKRRAANTAKDRYADELMTNHMQAHHQTPAERKI